MTWSPLLAVAAAPADDVVVVVVEDGANISFKGVLAWRGGFVVIERRVVVLLRWDSESPGGDAGESVVVFAL